MKPPAAASNAPHLESGWRAAFALILLLMLANAWVAYRAIDTLIDNEALVRLSLQRLAIKNSLLATLIDAETGQRGYLLTGDDSYLEPYDGAVAVVAERLQNLQALGFPNADEQEALAAVPPLIADKLVALRETIERYQTQGPDEARTLVASDRGQTAMQRLRTIFRFFEEREQQRLARRRAQSQQQHRYAQLTLAVATAAGLGLLAGALVLTRRVLRARAETETVLREANERLESEVAARTEELRETNAELRREIAERRQAEEEARGYAQALKRSNRELEDFAYVASHDLQEPLRKIRAFGDRLAQRYADVIDARGQDYIERMRQAAERMSALIADLLNFSRVTTRGVTFEPVDLNAIAAAVLEDLETRVEESAARVELGELPRLDADPMQMRQLLQNLIGNALKYRDPARPPEVRVDAVPAGDGAAVALSVSDNGIGFDEQYLDRIFTPFQRLHRRGKYEGTGMGLALARRICERHGGSIDARSRPGHGATFTVTLPLRQPATADALTISEDSV